MSGTSKMNGAVHMQERRPSLFDEDSPCVGDLDPDNSAIIPSEEAKSMLSFDLSDLSAERRLGEAQSKGGLSEVQLFSQHNNGVQVTYFDVGEHCSTPRFKSR